MGFALLAKYVPVDIVYDKSDADFIIEGKSNIRGTCRTCTFAAFAMPEATASIEVTSAKDGSPVFAYSVDKRVPHGQRSVAEACAKQLKEFIEHKGSYASRVP